MLHSLIDKKIVGKTKKANLHHLGKRLKIIVFK